MLEIGQSSEGSAVYAKAMATPSLGGGPGCFSFPGIPETFWMLEFKVSRAGSPVWQKGEQPQQLQR